MPGAALISAGAALAGNLVQNHVQALRDKEARAWQEKMYDRQRADNLADNHPAAQMERYKQAGINPNLVTGAPTMPGASVPSASQGSRPAPFDDIVTSAVEAANVAQTIKSQRLSDANETRRTDADIENQTKVANSQVSVNEAKAEQLRQQIPHEEAEEQRRQANERRLQALEERNKEMYDYYVNNVRPHEDTMRGIEEGKGKAEMDMQQFAAAHQPEQYEQQRKLTDAQIQEYADRHNLSVYDLKKARDEWSMMERTINERFSAFQSDIAASGYQAEILDRQGQILLSELAKVRIFSSHIQYNKETGMWEYKSELDKVQVISNMLFLSEGSGSRFVTNVTQAAVAAAVKKPPVPVK